MPLVWLRYGDKIAVTPLNCLYSACRGLLIDGHDPFARGKSEARRADRGFFSRDEDEEKILALAARSERVTANPANCYADLQGILEMAKEHHNKGIAHVWLASE